MPICNAGQPRGRLCKIADADMQIARLALGRCCWEPELNLVRVCVCVCPTVCADQPTGGSIMRATPLRHRLGRVKRGDEGERERGLLPRCIVLRRADWSPCDSDTCLPPYRLLRSHLGSKPFHGITHIAIPVLIVDETLFISALDINDSLTNMTWTSSLVRTQMIKGRRDPIFWDRR